MAATKRLICAASDLEESGKGVRFSFVRRGQEVPAFVVRFHGKVYAYLNRCTHVPVELDWQEGEFFDYSKLYLVCATHGALYAPESGHCLGGRCNGRGLIPLTVAEEGDSVYLMSEEE